MRSQVPLKLVDAHVNSCLDKGPAHAARGGGGGGGGAHRSRVNRVAWENMWRGMAASPEDAARAWDAALEDAAARVDRPVFVKQMTPSIISGGFWFSLPWGSLPEEILSCVDLDAPKCTIYLQGEGDVMYPCVWLKRPTGAGLSGGWRGFAIAHALNTADALVFERAPGDGPLVLLVTIHRAQEPTDAQLKAGRAFAEANAQRAAAAAAAGEAWPEVTMSAPPAPAGSMGAAAKAAPPADVEDEDDAPEPLFYVEMIMDHKRERGVDKYLIKWEGYGHEHDTWEPASSLDAPPHSYKWAKPSGAAAVTPSRAQKGSDALAPASAAEEHAALGSEQRPKRRGGKRAPRAITQTADAPPPPPEMLATLAPPLSSPAASPGSELKKSRSGKRKPLPAAPAERSADVPPAKRSKSTASASSPPAAAAAEGEIFIVEEILDYARLRGKEWFLIKWKGYGSEHNTWEPRSCLNAGPHTYKWAATATKPPELAEHSR